MGKPTGEPGTEREFLDTFPEQESIPQFLKDFYENYGNPSRSYKVQLFDADGKGSTLGDYLKAYGQDIPDYDDIAEEFGGGKYRLMIIYTPKNQKHRTSRCVTLKISDKYKKKRPAKDPETLPAIPESQTTDMPLLMSIMQQSNQNMMTMMQTFLTVIGDVMLEKSKRNNQDSTFIQKQMNDIIMSNAEQQQMLIEKLNNKRFGFPEEQAEAPEHGAGVIGFIKDIFYRYADAFINSNPTAQKLMGKQVKESQEFLTLLQHPNEYKKAYQQIIEENPANKDKLDTMLALLEAPDPNQMQENNAESES